MPPQGRRTKTEVKEAKPHELHAHEIVLKEAHTMARLAAESGDDGTNHLLVSDVIRADEKQIWFLSAHLVDAPLVETD